MQQHKMHLSEDGTIRVAVFIHVLISGERAGAFSLITSSKEAAQATLSQLKIIVRPMYSNPPIHGARIVTEIISDPSLKSQW
jgi:aspartate/tyrosine/aromatic aminotransferase